MRKINEIILHCSATKEGQHVGVDTIRNWHMQGNGWKDIGYHFVIYLDGTVMAGRPIEQAGAHCTDHNANSIGICYVGGLDKNGKAKDTRTPQQKDALLDLVFLLMEHYNLTKENVHVHNEYAAKACPSFSREAFLKEIDEAFPSRRMKAEIGTNIRIK